MDFGLTDEQRALLDSVDKMIALHLPPEEVRRRDQSHEPPDFLLKHYADLGLLAIPFPETYGGLGGAWQTVAVAHERLGYHAAMAASLLGTTLGFGGMSIYTYGSERQRETLLPKIIAGELRFSLGLTEPGAGTDAGALITRARRGDGGWIVNGRKTWISSADQADYIVTACRTTEGSAGNRGISMLLVPRGAEGIHMTPLAKVGNNCLSSWDIAFEDVFVPEEGLLGDEGDGFKHLMSTLQYSRSGQAANAIGQSQRAVDIAVAHVKEREQFGRPLGKFQAVAHRIADMQTRVDQARFILYHLAWLVDQGARCRKEAAQAKMVASECLQYVTHQGMQLLASAGYAIESDMQRLWRDSRLYTFGEGANEIQRDIIAREAGL
ncbi:MAG: acyl-CoA dehydrogenase family protein [Alphaproteobacteria bacterium]